MPWKKSVSSQPIVSSLPAFTVPTFTSAGCLVGQTPVTGAEYAEWPALRDLALAHGWSLPL